MDSRRQFGLVAALLVLTGVTDSAQQQPPQRPGLPTAAASTAIPPDEGVVQGRIVDDRSGRPIAKAVVSLSSSDGQKVAVTGPDGRYELRGLAPGTYQVYMRADGYVEGQYGQRQPEEAGRGVEVVGARLTRAINVRLRRAGAIGGRIFSRSGEGFPRVEIQLVTEGYGGGHAAQTDDEGMFRVGDLPPGRYYVRAHTGRTNQPSGTGPDEVYAPTFFPNATRIEDALPIFVSAGQEVAGVDFALVTVATFTVTGSVVGTTGRLGDQAAVMFHREGAFSLNPPVPVSPDGRFSISDLLPGDYVLRALDPANPHPGRAQEGTRVSVDQDVSDLLLLLPRGAQIAGRIMGDRARPLGFDPSTLRLAIEMRPGDGRTMTSGGTAATRPDRDGTFVIDGVGGPTILRVEGLPPGWSVKAIRLDGTDITYDATDFGEGQRRQVEIVLTDEVIPTTAVFGSVTDDRGRAVSDYAVVIFPQNRDRLRPPSPFVRSVRAEQNGAYRIETLPPADYLAIAVESLPAYAWRDPDVLERLWPRATPFRLDEGEHQVLNLRLARTPGRAVARPLAATPAVAR